MIVNSKILKTASVLSLLAAAAFSGVAGAAESADASPVFQEGTYVLKMGKKFLGHDVYFDLRNGGDTIDLPRGEFTLKKNEKGVHVNGCFSMYRGAEVIVDRQCGYKGGQIYCRTVPDWVEVQPGNEELNNIERRFGREFQPEFLHSGKGPAEQMPSGPVKAVFISGET